MKFEKKIIIGSITSFLATAIGVIAIFFPDLFNLQKDKMEKIEMTISTRQDAEKFKSFIEQREKDGKIFEANITLGNLPYDQFRNELYRDENSINTSFSSPNQSYGYTVFDERNQLKKDEIGVEFYVNDNGNKKDERYDKDMDCQVYEIENDCAGSQYYFPAISTKIDYKGYQDWSDETVVNIKGYFIVDEQKTQKYEYSGYMKQQISYYFQYIPKEQVLLKNY